MRLRSFLTLTEETSGKHISASDKVIDGKTDTKKSPEQLEAEKRQKELERVVQTVEMAPKKEQLNRAIDIAAPLVKQYGKQWRDNLEKALSVNIKPEIVKLFMMYVDNKAEYNLPHLKDNIKKNNIVLVKDE